MTILKTILEACRLDILDINFEVMSKEFNLLNIRRKNALPIPGYTRRLLSFCWRTAKHLLCGPWKYHNPPEKGLTLFYAASQNHHTCLSPVQALIKQSYFAGPYENNAQTFTLAAAYLSALPFLPCAIHHVLRTNGYQRQACKYYIDSLWLTYGFYIRSRLWLSKAHPKALFIANDFSPLTRIMNHVAKQLNIPVFLMQHGSVMKGCPPLDVTYAFLEGEDGAAKYASAGLTSTKVYLTGMPKLDAYSDKINTNSKMKTLGICTTWLDSAENIEHVVLAVRAMYSNIQIRLRPHPSDISRKARWQSMCDTHGIIFSDATNESSFAFLSTVDAVIGGNTCILLEAALINVFPIYYDFMKQKLDPYDYINNNLVLYMDNIEELQRTLARLRKFKPNIRNKAKPYCCTLETGLEGHSAHLIASATANICGNKPIDKAVWQETAIKQLQILSPTTRVSYE